MDRRHFDLPHLLDRKSLIFTKLDARMFFGREENPQ